MQQLSSTAGVNSTRWQNDVLHRCVLKHYRIERRPCLGRNTIYLRERKTGRLIGCSNNVFTLILQGA